MKNFLFNSLSPKIIYICFLIFLLVGCSLNREDEPQALLVTPSTTSESNLSPNENLNLSPCDLVSVAEMEAIFSESPLFFSEENGGCFVRNQWDTRSIWFTVTHGDQAFSAMQWHTNQLVEDWPTDNLRELADEIINDENNQSIETLQLARLPLYEELEYRWERLFTFGDYSYWITKPIAFRGIFDVVEGEIYYQIGYSGFLAAKIQPQLEDLSSEIFAKLPEQFMIDFDFSIEDNESPLVEIIKETPQVVGINKTSEEIYFGSLCEDEITTIRVFIENAELVDNVFLVYRLRSNTETNDNFTTVFMNQLSSDNWEVTLNAEQSFNTYDLVNAAQVEYSIALIYEVNKVLRTPNFTDILVLQCQQ